MTELTNKIDHLWDTKDKNRRYGIILLLNINLKESMGGICGKGGRRRRRRKVEEGRN